MASTFRNPSVCSLEFCFFNTKSILTTISEKSHPEPLYLRITNSLTLGFALGVPKVKMPIYINELATWKR